jgi:uncharacterized YigZ family protein
MKDQYKTLAESSQGDFKDRGSKFIAYAFPVYTESDWQSNLETVKKEHFKARHHCYAYRIGLDQNNFRANDDGEPSGTAGRPILGQIDSFGLTNVFIVVVRYFGGTKLGTSGLINAYRTAAQEALNQAIIIEKTVEDIYQINFDYALMSEVMNAVKKLELEILSQTFENDGLLEIAIAQSKVEDTIRQLRALIAKVRIEEIDQIETIEGLEINYTYTR